MGRLSGKRALITGAANGMGAAIAKRFADEGAELLLTDIEMSQLELVVNGLSGTAHVQCLDVSSEADWLALATWIGAEWGALNILANNAGSYSANSLLNTSVAEFDQVVRVNQLGCFLGMRTTVPFMRDGGSIINCSSAAGLRGSPNMFAYAGAKWAVRGMTKAAALELGSSKIRVNSIHPGPIATRMILGNSKEVNDGIIARTPLGRMGLPEEIADLVTFLASDESAYITGAEFAIDGGVSI